MIVRRAAAAVKSFAAADLHSRWARATRLGDAHDLSFIGQFMPQTQPIDR